MIHSRCTLLRCSSIRLLFFNLDPLHNSAIVTSYCVQWKCGDREPRQERGKRRVSGSADVKLVHGCLTSFRKKTIVYYTPSFLFQLFKIAKNLQVNPVVLFFSLANLWWRTSKKTALRIGFLIHPVTDKTVQQNKFISVSRYSVLMLIKYQMFCFHAWQCLSLCQNVNVSQLEKTLLYELL